jgi:hypothetical protein
MKLKLLALFGAFYLNGCAITAQDSEQFFANHNEEKNWIPIQSDSSVGSEFTYINGAAYKVQDGKILVSKQDLESHLSKDTQVFHPQPIVGLDLKENEMKTLMTDKDAFFIFLKNPTLADVGEVAFPIEKGSLKENIKRLAERMKLDGVTYESDFDYYIPEDQIVITKDAEELLYTMLKGFPLEGHISEFLGKRTLRVHNVDEKSNYLSFIANKGSLNAAATDLSKIAGWDYEWGFKYDFLIPETTIIRGASYEEIMNKLLKLQKYPIKAEKTGEN